MKNIASLLLTLILISCNKTPESIRSNETIVSPEYMRNRNLIINTTNDDLKKLGIAQSAAIPNVWGVMVDVSLPDVYLTVVSRAEPSSGIHWAVFESEGESFIGFENPPDVAHFARLMLSESEKVYQSLDSVKSFSLPDKRKVKFYFFTFAGTFASDVEITELEKSQHQLSPIYLLAKDLSLKVINGK